MAASVAHSPQPQWFPQQFSPHLAIMAGTPPTQHMAIHPPKARTKMDMCAAFIEKLQARRNLDLTPELVEGIEQHFRLLPSRYALDVNISSLDVLNHKRLLDSARADPSAVSFQVRPVDIVSTAGNRAALDRRPSFGNAESLMEVSHKLHQNTCAVNPAFETWRQNFRLKQAGNSCRPQATWGVAIPYPGLLLALRQTCR